MLMTETQVLLVILHKGQQHFSYLYISIAEHKVCTCTDQQHWLRVLQYLEKWTLKKRILVLLKGFWTWVNSSLFRTALAHFNEKHQCTQSSFYNPLFSYLTNSISCIFSSRWRNRHTESYGHLPSVPNISNADVGSVKCRADFGSHIVHMMNQACVHNHLYSM